MKRLVCAALLVPLLAACGDPVFVPEAGPGAPGYRMRAAPPPPEVEVVRTAPAQPLPAGGVIDGVARHDDHVEVTGWAFVDPKAPRGVLQLLLPAGADAAVVDVETMPRPDVVTATGQDALIWSGFTVTLRGALPEGANVCMLSRSEQGAFRLGGSDEALCPV